MFFDIDDVCDRPVLCRTCCRRPTFSRRRCTRSASPIATMSWSTTSRARHAAPRVWWTFRAFGHGEVSVLNGGLAKWLAAGLPVTDQPARQRQASFTAQFDLARSVRGGRTLGARRWYNSDHRQPAGRPLRGVERNTRRCAPVISPHSRNVPFSSFFDVEEVTASGDRPMISPRYSRLRASTWPSRLSPTAARASRPAPRPSQPTCSAARMSPSTTALGRNGETVTMCRSKGER